MTKKKRAILLTLAALILSLVVAFVLLFKAANVECSENEVVFSVKEKALLLDVLEDNGIELKFNLTLQISATLKRLRHVKPGRYRMVQGMSNSDVIREFRSGGIATVKVRIDDVTTLEDLAAKLGSTLLHDSTYFVHSFYNDSVLKSMECYSADASTLIRPNTYEFYWNMSDRDFLTKMKAECDKVWNENRLSQATAMGMTVSDITTLASIVKAETGTVEEAPRIAGLYLNRLQMGMPLQSDPTTLFGRKKNAQRVYLSDLQADTPYNTYKIKGLPPGPINFPETVYIDAVLEPEHHTYIYMCAEPGGTGRHRFSESLSEHERNRAEYVKWVEKKGIR